jgi:hypothetical protein
MPNEEAADRDGRNGCRKDDCGESDPLPDSDWRAACGRGQAMFRR